MPRFLLLIICTTFLSGCSRFNKDHLMTSQFGSDLSKLEDAYETKYADGSLQVFYTSTSDPKISRFFKEPWNETIYVEFDDLEFDSSDCGKIYYREAGDYFDSYYPIIVHIPSLKLLVFGYSSGLGG